MPRPIRATISAGALAHNFLVAKAYAGGAKLWAVLKANAYGHGLERAARALEAARGVAVIHNAEQVEMLRLADLGGEIDVYLKVNSGMNRLGFMVDNLRPAYNAVRLAPPGGAVTLMTH